MVGFNNNIIIMRYFGVGLYTTVAVKAIWLHAGETLCGKGNSAPPPFSPNQYETLSFSSAIYEWA